MRRLLVTLAVILVLDFGLTYWIAVKTPPHTKQITIKSKIQDSESGTFYISSWFDTYVATEGQFNAVEKGNVITIKHKYNKIYEIMD